MSSEPDRSVSDEETDPMDSDGKSPDPRRNSYSKDRPCFRRNNSFSQNLTRRNSRKRRLTISDFPSYCNSGKHLKLDAFAFPTRFLLGGNIHDPLNLTSLEDNPANFRPETTVTNGDNDIQSNQEVRVMIPSNINDPLNLNTGAEIKFNSCLKKRKRRRRIVKNASPKELLNTVVPDTSPIESYVSPIESNVPFICENTSIPFVPKNNDDCSNQIGEKCKDKIVSPAVPQGSKYFYKTFYSRQKTSAYLAGARGKTKRKGKKKEDNIGKSKFGKRFHFGNFDCFNKGKLKAAARVKALPKVCFAGKDVLDIGCNTGFFSVYIAQYYEAKKVLGIDIDVKLVRYAKKYLLLQASHAVFKDPYLESMKFYGPIMQVLPPLNNELDTFRFPHNVSFIQMNYVPDSDDDLLLQQQEYDVILFLHMSQWIQLNWGDNALKRTFKRIYYQLRNGGCLIFEASVWSSYTKHRKMTQTTYENYSNITMRPEEFVKYLLSKEVGFISCEVLRQKRGHYGPLYLFTKDNSSGGEDVNCSHIEQISPIVYNDAEWASNDEEMGDMMDGVYSSLAHYNVESSLPSPPTQLLVDQYMYQLECGGMMDYLNGIHDTSTNILDEGLVSNYDDSNVPCCSNSNALIDIGSEEDSTAENSDSEESTSTEYENKMTNSLLQFSDATNDDESFYVDNEENAHTGHSPVNIQNENTLDSLASASTTCVSSSLVSDYPSSSEESLDHKSGGASSGHKVNHGDSVNSNEPVRESCHFLSADVRNTIAQARYHNRIQFGSEQNHVNTNGYVRSPAQWLLDEAEEADEEEGFNYAEDFDEAEGFSEAEGLDENQEFDHVGRVSSRASNVDNENVLYSEGSDLSQEHFELYDLPDFMRNGSYEESITNNVGEENNTSEASIASQGTAASGGNNDQENNSHEGRTVNQINSDSQESTESEGSITRQGDDTCQGNDADQGSSTLPESNSDVSVFKDLPDFAGYSSSDSESDVEYYDAPHF